MALPLGSTNRNVKAKFAVRRLSQLKVKSRGPKTSKPAASGRSGSSCIQQKKRRIEDHAKGYPRFASLIGNDPAFTLSRQFSIVRARLLLKKQDKVALLEQQLQEVDQRESRILFLGSMRKDQNVERETVMNQLDSALSDYDGLLERNARILSLPTAMNRYRTSLSNWITNTGSICRKESSFLEEGDLCSLEKSADSGMSVVEQFVETLLISLFTLFGVVSAILKSEHPEYLFASGRESSADFWKSPPSTISEDVHIFVFKSSMLKAVTMTVINWIIITLLLVPVIMIRLSSNAALQTTYLLVALGIFLFVLSVILHAKTTDIFIAGPAYAAILVAFMASKNSEA